MKQAYLIFPLGSEIMCISSPHQCPQHLVISFFRKLESILMEHQGLWKTSIVAIKGLVSSQMNQVKYEGPVLLWLEAKTRLNSSGLSYAPWDYLLCTSYRDEVGGMVARAFG